MHENTETVGISLRISLKASVKFSKTNNYIIYFNPVCVL